MRISLIPKDRGYTTYLKNKNAQVFLAGSARWNVVTADEEERKATTLKLDLTGEPLLDKAGRLIVETFRGDVLIRLDPAAPVVLDAVEDYIEGYGL